MIRFLRGSLLLLLLLVAGWAMAESPPTSPCTPSPDLFAYVTNAVSDTVTVFNVATRTLVATIPVGNNPFGIAVTPNYKFAYVANHDDNTVSVIDTCSNAVVAVVPVGQGPADVAVSPDGSLVLVTNNTDCSVSVIDTAINTVIKTIPKVCMPFGVTFTPNGEKAYVSDYGSLVTGEFGCTVTVIDIATLTVVKTIPVGYYPMGVVVTPDGQKLYVSDYYEGLLSIINTGTDSVVKTKAVGDGPFNVAVTPDGAYVYNTLFNQNQVAVIDTVSDNILPSLYNTAEYPSGIAITPEGCEAWVTNYGSDNLSIINIPGNTVSTLSSGGAMPFDVAFAVRKPCRALAAVVYWDKDDNGSFDGSDTLLKNWTVTLTDGNGGTKTGQTDDNGRIEFTELRPGTYTLAESPQNGWYNTTPLSVTVVVPTNANPADTYFGNDYRKLCGVVFWDKDDNGSFGGSDTLLKNWQVTLTDGNGGTITALTDDNGKVCFDHLVPGTYTLAESPQSGWYNTTPLSVTVVVPTNANPADTYFGNNVYKQCLIAYKWKDCNRNAKWDCGEPGLANWTIQVYDANGKLVDSTVTNSCGKAVFYLLPGVYTVKEVMQTDWENITPAQYTVTVPLGQAAAPVYFGNAPVIKQRITAYKFKDCNRNWTWDCGEPAIPNWTIQVLDANGKVVDSKLTDCNGRVEFLVIPGNYTVQEVMQNGWVNTRPVSKAITVTAGYNPATIYFGNVTIQKQRITAYKFKDCNRNGSWDCGEPALSYWTIQLYDATGALIATDVTDCYGRADFYAVPGTYTVKEVMQDGWVNTRPIQVAVTIEPWKDPCPVYFGNAQIVKQRIVAYKFKDCNRNWSWDCGEPALANWTIKVYDANGAVVDSKVTDCSGRVEFWVVPGTYTVKEVMQTGWVNIRKIEYPVTVVAGCNPGTIYFGNMTTSCWW